MGRGGGGGGRGGGGAGGAAASKVVSSHLASALQTGREITSSFPSKSAVGTQIKKGDKIVKINDEYVHTGEVGEYKTSYTKLAKDNMRMAMRISKIKNGDNFEASSSARANRQYVTGTLGNLRMWNGQLTRSLAKAQ